MKIGNFKIGIAVTESVNDDSGAYDFVIIPALSIFRWKRGGVDARGIGFIWGKYGIYLCVEKVK